MIAHGISPASPETDAPPGFGMTELEEALHGSDGEQTRLSTVARIDGLIGKVEDQFSVGVDPRQVESMKRVRVSLDMARRVVVSTRR